MTPGQTLTYATLRSAAEHAASSAGLTQTEVARSLRVTQGAISRALREEGPSRAALQARIIEALTEYQVGEVGGFVVERKPAS